MIIKESIFKKKSEEEVYDAISKSSNPLDLLVIRVWSGQDAFQIKKPNKENIYLPYIDVLAKTSEEARKIVAILLNQKLEDQDTNPEYNNYVSEHTEIINKF